MCWWDSIGATEESEDTFDINREFTSLFKMCFMINGES